MLRFSMIAAAAVLLVACGDDSRPVTDGGADTSVTVDSTVGDSSPPTDSSPPVDTGVPPTDSGTGGSCGGDACDLVTGGGCMAGQGCQFLAPMMGADPTAMCVPAGTAGDGATCMTYMDCQEGFACVTPEGAMEGTCQHYCCPGSAGSSSPCPTGQTCSTTFAGTDVGFCAFADDCDPVGMTGCAGTEACYPGPDGTFQCATPGDLAEGDTCDMFVNECEAGLACLMGECYKLCDTESGMGCGPMQACSIMLSGFDSLGACQDSSM
jgi:hypothetical protein